jgi:hypothetical protein
LNFLFLNFDQNEETVNNLKLSLEEAYKYREVAMKEIEGANLKISEQQVLIEKLESKIGEAQSIVCFIVFIEIC